jgi:hypothetical protein
VKEALERASTRTMVMAIVAQILRRRFILRCLQLLAVVVPMPLSFAMVQPNRERSTARGLVNFT